MFNKRRRGSNGGDFGHLGLSTPIGASNGGNHHHGSSGFGGGRQPAFNSDNFPSSRKSTPKHQPSDTGSQYSYNSRRSSNLGSRLNRLGGVGGAKSRKKHQEDNEDQQARRNLLDDQSVNDAANQTLQIQAPPSRTRSPALNSASLGLNMPSLGVGAAPSPRPSASPRPPAGSSSHHRRESSSHRRESSSAHHRRIPVTPTPKPMEDFTDWTKSIVVPPPPETPSSHARPRRPSASAAAHTTAANIAARERFFDGMMHPEPPSQTNLVVEEDDDDEEEETNNDDGVTDPGAESDTTPISPMGRSAEARPAPPSAPATPTGGSSENTGSNKVKKSKMEKIQELLAINKELRKNNRTMKSEMEKQSKLLEESKKEVQRKAVELTDFREEQKLQAVAAASSEELEKAKREAERAKQDGSRMKRELGQKKREITSLQKELDANMKEVNGLRSTLNETLAQVDALEDEHDKDKSKMLKLTRELTVARRGNAAASFDQEEMEETKAQLAQVELDLRSAQMELDNTQTELNQAQSELNHAQTELTNTKSELNHAQSSLRERDRIIDSQRQEVDSQVEKNLKLQADLDKRVMTPPPSPPKTPPPPMRHLRRSSSPGLGECQARQLGSSMSHEEIREEYEDRLRDLEETEQRQADIIADQRRDWNRLQNEKDGLMQELEHTKKALYQAEEEKRTMTVSTSESDEASQLRRDTDMLQSALREANDRNRELEEKLATLEMDDDDSKDGSFVVHGGFKPMSDTKSGANNLQREIVQLEKELEKARDDQVKAEEMSRLATSRLNIEMLALQNDFDHSKIKCSRLEEEAVDLRKARDDLALEIQRLATQNADLQQKTDSQVHQAKALSSSHAEDVSNLEMENKTLRAEKCDLDSRVVALGKEVNTWKAATGRIKSDFQESEKKVRSMEANVRQCEELREECSSLKKRIGEMESSLQDVRSDRDKWRSSSVDFEKEASTAREALADAETLREKLSMTQQRALSFEAENSEAVTKVGSMTAERDNWKVEADKAIAECEALRPIVREHEQLKRDYDKMATHKEELETERDNLASQLVELAKNRDDWKESTEQVESEAAVLRAKATLLEDTERDLTVLEAEAEKLRLFKAQAEIEISQLQEERDDLRTAASDAERDAEVSREKVAAYETSIDDYQLLQDETEELRKHVTEQEAKINHLEGELVEAREAGYNLADELEEARDAVPQLQESQAELEAVEFEAEQLRELTKLQETDFDELQHSHDELQRSHEELKEAVAIERAAAAKTQEDLQEELLETRQRFSFLESKVGECESEAAKLTEEAEEWKSKAIEIQAELDETRIEMQSLEQTSEAYRELQEEAEMQSNRVRELEVETEDLARQRDEWRTLAEDEEHGVSAGQTAMKALQDIQHDHTLVVKDLEAQRQANEVKSEELKQASTERDEWQQKTESLVLELESAQQTIQSLEQAEDDLLVLTEEAQRLDGQVIELEEQVALLTGERDQLVKNNERSNEETAQARALFEAKDSETMATLTKLQEDSRLLNEKNDQLQAELDSTKADLEAWKDAAGRTETDAKEAQAAVSDLEAEVHRLKQVESDAETLRLEQAQLMVENKVLSERVGQLESDVKEGEKVAEDLKSKEEEMSVLETELVSQKSGADSLREEFLALQRTLDATQTEREEWKRKADATTIELEEANKKFSAASEVSEQQIDDLKKLNEQLSAQVVELEEDVDGMSKRIEEVTAREANLKLSIARQNDDFEQRMTAADKSIAEAKRGTEDLVVQLEEIRLELDKTQGERDEAIAAHATTTRTIAELEERLKGGNARLEDVEAENLRRHEEMTDALEKTQQERDQWEKRACEAERACDGLKESNDTYALDAQKMQRELDDVHEAAEKATLANVLAQEQIESLRSSKSANESLKKECEHYRSEHSMLEAQLVSVKKERDEWMDAAETNKTEASHAVASVATTRTELLELNKQMEDLRRQNSDITSELRGADSDRNELKKALSDAKVEAAAAATATSQSLAQVEADKAALEENIRDLKREAREYGSLLESTRSERDSSIAEVQKVQDEAHQAARIAETHLEKVESRLAEVEGEMEAMRIEKEDYAEKVGELSLQVMQHQQAAVDRVATTNELQEDLQSLRSKSNEQETQIGSLRRERDASMAEVSQAREETDRVAKEAEIRLLESEDTIGALRRENADLQAEKEKIARQMAHLSSQVSELQSTQEEHTVAATKARDLADDAARDADAKLSRAENEMSVLRKKNEDLETEKEDFAAEVDNLTVQLSEVQQQASVQRASGEEEARYLRDQIAEFEMKVQSLQQELSTSKESETKSLADVARTQNDSDALRKENATLQSELDDHAEKVGKLSLQLMEMQQQASADRTSTEGEVQSLRVQIGEFEMKMESLQQELDKSTESETRARADVVQAENDLESLRNENAALVGEKNDYAEKVENLTAQLTEIRTRTEEEGQNLRIEICELEAKVGSLQQELDKSSESTKQTLADLQAENDKYSETVSSLSAKIADLQQESTVQLEAAEELDEEVRLLQLKLEEKESELESLVTERDESIAAEKARGEAELARQQEELVELLQKMGRLQEDKDDYAEKVAHLSLQVMELQAAADSVSGPSFDSSSHRDNMLLNQTQNELALLRVEADKLREENTAYSSKVKSLSSDLLELQADKHNLSRYSDEDENQPVTQQSGESVEELAELRTTVDLLQQEVDALSQERDEWRSQAAEQQSKSISRDRTLSTSTSSRYMDASMMMDQLHKEMDELRLRNLTNQNEIQRLVEERDRWRQKAEQPADLESVAGQSTKSETPVQQQLDELRERNGALERQLEQATQGRWNDPNAQVLDDLRTRNTILESQLEVLTAERDDWKEKVTSAQEADDNQTVNTSVSQQQALLLEAALARKRKEKSRRTGWFKRSSATTTAPTLDETLDGLYEDKQALAMDLDEDELRKLLDEREAHVAKLKKEVVQLNMSLKEENHRNQKALQRLNQENSAYELKIHAMESELERMAAETSQEIQDIQDDFEDLAKESRATKARLEKELADSREQLKAAKHQLEALEKIIQAMDRENESLRGSIKTPLSSEKREKVQQDAKDVQIAQFHYELVNLRMQLDTVRHEDLQKRIIDLEKEKLGFKHEMEDKMQAALKENEGIVEQLQNKLRRQDSTIVMLEEQLEVQMHKMANAL